MTENYDLLMSQTRLSRQDIQLISGISRPTLNRFLQGEELQYSKHRALRGAMKLVANALEQGLLPAKRTFRATPEDRRVQLMTILAQAHAVMTGAAVEAPAPDDAEETT